HRQREEHVEDAHAREERGDRVELALDGAWLTYGPCVEELELGAVFECGYDVIEGVLTLRGDALDHAGLAWWNQDLVGEGELGHRADDVSCFDGVADFGTRSEAPLGFSRQRVDDDAA